MFDENVKFCNQIITRQLSKYYNVRTHIFG